MTDAWTQVLAEIHAFQAGIRDIPVAPPVAPEALRRRLEAAYDLESPIPTETLVNDVTRLLRAHSVHVVHPRYFGLFNPSVRNAGIIGDTLAALYNPQLAAWSHAPAAQELERLVLRRLSRALGMEPSSSASNFTTGGAEANLSAVLCALAAKHPRVAELGLQALSSRPLIYLSKEGHDSFVKIARMTGLGTDALRRVDVDRRFSMDVAHLEELVRSDVQSGHHPLMIVGTAGTTATGAVDPLGRLAAFARESGAWFHVDAAWGGSAVLSDDLRPALLGIEHADSVTWDAHKWLSVPMAAGMFFCREAEAVHRAFTVMTSYMPVVRGAEPDPYQSTFQWSRRAIGLKVFLSLAEIGIPGYAALLDHQARMADALRAGLTEGGWQVRNETPLPIVCFSHPDFQGDPSAADEIAEAIVGRGQAWISTVRPSGSVPLLRACVTSFRTELEDIEFLLSELERGRRLRRERIA